MEVVLIVALVAVTFVGVMSLSRRLLQMENMVKNEFIAQGLLREGVELVEAVKNANLGASQAFYTDLVSSTPPTAGQFDRLRMDAASVVYPGGRASIIHSLSGSTATAARLKINNSDFTTLYNYSSGSETIFYRTIETTYRAAVPPAEDFLDVTVRVDWAERGRSHVNLAKTKIYDVSP